MHRSRQSLVFNVNAFQPSELRLELRDGLANDWLQARRLRKHHRDVRTFDDQTMKCGKKKGSARDAGTDFFEGTTGDDPYAGRWPLSQSLKLF